MDIQTQLQELEKRLASISKASAPSTDIQNKINGILISLQKLQQSVNENESSIEGIKETIQSLEQSVSSLEQQCIENTQVSDLYGLLIQQVDAKITECEDAIVELNAKIEELNNAGADVDLSELEAGISSNTSRIEDLEGETQNLNGRITVLETSSGGCECVETFNMGIEEDFNIFCKDNQKTQAVLFLRCEPTAQIKGQVKVKFHNLDSTVTNLTSTVSLDSDVVETKSYTGPFSADQEFTFNLNFFPTQNHYKLTIFFETTNAVDLHLNCGHLELSGRNLMLLNRLRDFHMYHNYTNYYFTFTTVDGGSYLAQAEGAEDLSLTPTAIKDPGYGSFYKYFKHAAWNITTNTFNNNTASLTLTIKGVDGLIGTVAVSTTVKKYKNNYIDVEYVMRSDDGTTYSVVGVQTDGAVKMNIYQKLENANYSDDVKLNDVILDNIYIQCIPVYDNYLTTRTELNSAGFILLDRTGRLTYMPTKLATYAIDLGYGCQPNGYIQQDNSTIHIYYTYCGSTYKRVLIKNSSTGEWELQQGKEFFPGVTDFREGVNGLSVRRLNGNYQIFNA